CIVLKPIGRRAPRPLHFWLFAVRSTRPANKTRRRFAMRNHSIKVSIVLVTLFGLCVASAQAQNSQDTVEAHLIAARNAAGFDFTGTLARLCVAPPTVTAIRDVAPGTPPARDTWFIEPAKVFDNLYFVGSKIQSVFALTTSDGIILLDTLYTYNSEEEI